MDFLHRLAASVRADAPALRAALPSRFEAGGPWPAPVAAGAPEPARPTEPGAAAVAPTGSSHEPAPSRSPLREAADQPFLRVESPAVWGQQPEPVPTSQAVPLPSTLPQRRQVVGEPMAPAAGVRPVRAEALPALQSPPLPSLAMPLRAAAQPEPAAWRTPLSAATLAQRSERDRQEPSRYAPAEARPVIHVTIDRIDVRAPAAPAAQPAARGRHKTPTVSLSDYLRGNARGGRGDAQ